MANPYVTSFASLLTPRCQELGSRLSTRLIEAFNRKMNMQHALTWFDIPVADMARAMRFYETMLGTTLTTETFGPPGEVMAVFKQTDPEAISGCLLSSPHVKPSDQGAIIYLNAGSSIDACLTRAQNVGAKIITPKTALPPGMGFFAHIRDSEGNRVGLHALS